MPGELTSIAPTDALVTRENNLHPKQDKIVVTGDGTLHMLWSSWPADGGAGYARSYDGGATWTAQQFIANWCWIGNLEVDDNDNVYVVLACNNTQTGERGPATMSATVDKGGAEWSWTWSDFTTVLPTPPLPRQGFVSAQRDSEGTFHLVTTSTSAFSIDNPEDDITVGVYYYRSSAPDDVSSFDLVEQIRQEDINPIEIPGVALALGGEAAVALDGDDNVVVAYSDRALYQAGEDADTWQDPGERGIIFAKRYRRTATGWEIEAEQTVATGTYGGVDILTDAVGVTHFAYTRVDTGYDYRVAYRQMSPDGVLGPEVLPTQPDLTTIERTNFPSLAAMDDGTVVLGFTDRLSHPKGHIGVVVADNDNSFGCVLRLTEGDKGYVSANLYHSEYDGNLLMVYNVGSDDVFHTRFASFPNAGLPR